MTIRFSSHLPFKFATNSFYDHYNGFGDKRNLNDDEDYLIFSGKLSS